MTKKNTQRKCALCAKNFSAKEESKNLLPFCSKRCKMIDLGQWLGEKYAFTDGDQDIRASDPAIKKYQ